MAALLAGFWLDGAARPEQLSFYGKHVATAIGTGLLITVGVAGSGSLRGAMRWRPIVWFGERGYGVFLWHLPVIWALLGFPMVEIDGSRSGMLELALWTVPITCLLAEATYRLIEQPAMAMPRPPLASLVRHPPWFLVPFAAGLLIFGWWIVSSAVA